MVRFAVDGEDAYRETLEDKESPPQGSITVVKEGSTEVKERTPRAAENGHEREMFLESPNGREDATRGFVGVEEGTPRKIVSAVGDVDRCFCVYRCVTMCMFECVHLCMYVCMHV